ncbi:hypothetical protein [Nocardioides flavescens]|uniref:Uncharacterized protein n=1 Tax=Nocardioides flavescens TaxID=2691959 RepID=A0A6L7EYF6_9ACTN|nr:hypothetical protein [Nocardioides flavescens]MXG88811.1 hypothetical protein [Nocardioides flavescens]
MTQSSPPGGGAPVVRRFTDFSTPAPPYAVPGRSGGGPDGPEGGSDAAGMRGAGVPGTIDEFVDAVVAKIEQRVIDELERRGRSPWTGF